MKKLTILLLLTFSLFAKERAFTIPVQLQLKLCEQLAQNTNRCENGSTLDYYKHLVLSDDRLLIFLYLNEHTKSYKPTSTAIPVVVNSIGEWRATFGENSISEDIESLHQDPHNNIWVRAIWHLEGLFPALYHSPDAIHWKRTRLPENRDVDCCFESIDEPIFLWNTVQLTFRNLDNTKIKSWATTYKSAMSNTPIWQPVPNSPAMQKEPIDEGNWKVNTSSKEISFSNNLSKLKIVLPTGEKRSKKFYHIQVGAFSKMSSAKIVMKSLKNMPYIPFTKVVVVNGKKYIKLLIGEFTSKRKAKFILNKIKKEHQNNVNIQKAFILTSKL